MRPKHRVTTSLAPTMDISPEAGVGGTASNVDISIVSPAKSWDMT